ncbi:uncharacterized protein LOC130221922 [Danio aesculapii]|uniref:uncharacterized protein LOC130221922 n=1 Tax=Danio aesculapii TaxID=1142201 RepID=UPI0024BFFC57|nr:uncharacterized protein LOC130221922 [Danio aesculapii]
MECFKYDKSYMSVSFCSPFVGELLGVDYLLSQTGQPMALNPDSEETEEMLEDVDKGGEEDEGFGKDEVYDITVPSLSDDPNFSISSHFLPTSEPIAMTPAAVYSIHPAASTALATNCSIHPLASTALATTSSIHPPAFSDLAATSSFHPPASTTLTATSSAVFTGLAAASTAYPATVSTQSAVSTALAVASTAYPATVSTQSAVSTALAVASTAYPASASTQSAVSTQPPASSIQHASSSQPAAIIIFSDASSQPVAHSTQPTEPSTQPDASATLVAASMLQQSTSTSESGAVDGSGVPGMGRVDSLADYLVDLRNQPSLVLTNQQNLLDYDKQRVVFAARHQAKLDTGRFRSPKKRQEFTPGVESLKGHALTTSAPLAQWPDCCRLVETIFVRLCAIHRTPKKKGTGTVSRWDLILADCRKIRRSILANAIVMKQTNLQLVDVSHTTLVQWHNKKVKQHDTAVVMQGLQLPSRLSVAADPLLPANVSPPSPPPQPSPAHQYHLPSSTVGQAKEKGPFCQTHQLCHLLRCSKPNGNLFLLHHQGLNWSCGCQWPHRGLCWLLLHRLLGLASLLPLLPFHAPLVLLSLPFVN